MSRASIVAYTYRADMYCPDCIKHVMFGDLSIADAPNAEECLDRFAGILGVDREDEYTFDSDNFPKVVFGAQIESVEHCATCGGEL